MPHRKRDPEPPTDTAARTTIPLERLNLAELVVAELGGWASSLLYRCHPPVGPFFAADGRMQIDVTLFFGEADDAAPPDPTA
ncbi:MAG: hypothetical protein ACHQ4H_15830 [Ktedonobacterales bacterium]